MFDGAHLGWNGLELLYDECAMFAADTDARTVIVMMVMVVLMLVSAQR